MCKQSNKQPRQDGKTCGRCSKPCRADIHPEEETVIQKKEFAKRYGNKKYN